MYRCAETAGWIIQTAVTRKAKVRSKSAWGKGTEGLLDDINEKKIFEIRSSPGVLMGAQKFTDFRWIVPPCFTKVIDNLQIIHQSKALIELCLKKFSLIFSDHFEKSYKTPNVQNVQNPYREGWLPLAVIIKLLLVGRIDPTLFSYVRAHS